MLALRACPQSDAWNRRRPSEQSASMEDQSGGDSFAGELSSEVHHDRACSWDRVTVADLVQDAEESVASVALLCEHAAVMSQRGS